MKILAISTESPDAIMGGMGEHIRNLYRAMAAQGHSIRVATLADKPGRYEFHGFGIHNIDPWLAYRERSTEYMPIANVFEVEKKLLALSVKMILEERPDVIHYHECFTAPVGEELKRIFNLPTVATTHLSQSLLFPNHEMEFLDRYWKAWEGRMIELATELIAPSRAYGRMPKDLYFSERPVNVIYNGVWYEDWARCRATVHPRGERPNVLFCGRISEQKGIGFISEIVKRTDEFKFSIMGELATNDPNDWERWKPAADLLEAARRFSDRLELLGFLREPMKQEAFARADAVFMPSIHEPFGIVALEAFAAGRPLVCTQSSGLAEFTEHGYNAECVDFDADSMIAGLQRVTSDPVYAAAMVKRGDDTARKMNWFEVAEATVKVYENAIGGYHADPVIFAAR